MKRVLKFYNPKEGLKNKAGTTNLTIDWFKKKFRMPIDSKVFDEINYEEKGSDLLPPDFKWLISVTHENSLLWQGRVEGIAQEKVIDGAHDEVIHILLQPL